MIRLAVRCKPDQAELVLSELLVLAPNGVEEEAGPDWIEYAIYGAEGEVPDLGQVRAVLGGDIVEVRSEHVPDDWADRWRDFHQATLVADRVLIRPTWADPVAGTIDVQIDPGQAFGTGAHPTTRMCVELLLELADERHAEGAIADLGTGSAILAIVAARLGWDPVLGVDHEQAAIEAAAKNAAANGVELELERVNLREDAPPAATTLVANLTAPLLREVAKAMTEPPVRMVCSGLLAREREDVVVGFQQAGLALVGEREAGEWAALRLARIE